MKIFKFSGGSKRYLINTSWMMIERIVRVIIAFFVSIYLARYLGPHRLGLLSYAISFVGLFSALSMFGIHGLVVRELVKKANKKNQILGTAFLFKITGILILWCLITIILSLSEGDIQSKVLIAIISFSVVFQSFGVIDCNFQSEVKSKYVVRAQISQLLITALTTIILINVEADLVWFALVYCLDAMVLALGLIVIYHRYTVENMLHWQWQWSIANRLMKEGWPLILSGVVVSLYMKIDQVMIKEILDSEQVGIYASAVKLSEAWYFLPLVITSSVFPAIVNAKLKNQALYEQRQQRLYDLVVWISILIAVPVTMFSDSIISLLYGEAYQGAGSVLMLHIWAGVFVFISEPSAKWLINENLQIYTTINTAIGAFINITLNFYLIRYFGIEGAAMATLVSYFMASYFCLIFFKKTRGNFMMITRSFNLYRVIKVEYSNRSL